MPALREELAAEGREDIMIVVGGVIPPQDIEALHEDRHGGMTGVSSGELFNTDVHEDRPFRRNGASPCLTPLK
ncbi:hypothetical protein SMICM304S_02162 [Streptomyces microflavus]